MSGPSKIASKVKFPKLSNPPSYKGFVKGLIDLPSTKKVISTMTKDIVDLEYKGQLRSMPSLDERSLITYLGQSKSRDGQAVWSGVVHRFRLDAPTSKKPNEMVRRWTSELDAEDPLAKTMQNLDIPLLATRAHGDKAFDVETYDNFARKLEQRNPNVRFDRRTTDTAFRFACSKKGKDGAAQNMKRNLDKMMQRCLGEESDAYWENR